MANLNSSTKINIEALCRQLQEVGSLTISGTRGLTMHGTIVYYDKGSIRREVHSTGKNDLRGVLKDLYVQLKECDVL